MRRTWRLPAGRGQDHRCIQASCKVRHPHSRPRLEGRSSDEEKILANAYRNSLKEALRVGAKTVAFPAISTGVYRFPPDIAADIAVMTITSFLREHDAIEEVRLVCFSEESAEHHRHALDKHLP